jgi:hypothetical protein
MDRREFLQATVTALAAAPSWAVSGAPALQQTIDARLRLFIPSPAVLIPIATEGDFGFHGDGRGFAFNDGTARADIWVDIDNSMTNEQPVREKFKDFGITSSYSREKLVDVMGKPFWWKAIRRVPLLNIEEAPNAIGKAPVTNSSLRVTGRIDRGPFGVAPFARVAFHVDAGNPLHPLAPVINCDIELAVGISALGGFSYSLTGTHDGFPAYELYLQKRLVYSHDPVARGNTPLDLGSPVPVTVNVPLTLFIP